MGIFDLKLNKSDLAYSVYLLLKRIALFLVQVLVCIKQRSLEIVEECDQTLRRPVWIPLLITLSLSDVIVLCFLCLWLITILVGGQGVHERKYSFFYFHLIQNSVAYLHPNTTQYIFFGHYARLAYLVSSPIHFLNTQRPYLRA